MAETSNKARSLEYTPTWAVAVVCFVLVVISIIIEHAIHMVGKWLKKKHKPALYEALEKVKAELMLMGFISLLLTVAQGTISGFCIPESIANTWHPCGKKAETKKDSEKDSESTGRKLLEFSDVSTVARRSLASKEDTWKSCICIDLWYSPAPYIHLCVSNFPYPLLHNNLCFGKNQGNGRPGRKRQGQLNINTTMVCFFRQFFGSVTKVDYLTLRHGFITAHLAPGNETKFDFQKYIKRSLEEDFKVVVGISPIIWFIAVLFLLAYTHGWYSYLWLPFLPLVIILMVGTKLQVIITKLGLRIQDRGDVVKGAPVVQPGDDLFWFGRPRFLLFLIHLVLFTNAFQLAFFVWSTYEFTIKSCYHEHLEDIIIRMGTNMRPTIFNERVAAALKSWHHTAKKHTKHSRQSENTTPFSSRPATPTHGMSPVHLLNNHPRSVESYHTSPRNSNFENDQWDLDSPRRRAINDSVHDRQLEMREVDRTVQEYPSSSSHMPQPPQTLRTQHEIDISSSDFSFAKR
ncbi:Mlo-related protein - like 3 [Theobroma cacao]|nr:Mlo-related protein - like 3 [Theobroma cacao]